MHVSAAVHASELTPGSTPAQQRVGMGSVVTTLVVSLKIRLHDHRFLGVHWMLVSIAVTAELMLS
jgi:hypothetical protein